jgi:hypothetical protein
MSDSSAVDQIEAKKARSTGLDDSWIRNLIPWNRFRRPAAPIDAMVIDPHDRPNKRPLGQEAPCAGGKEDQDEPGCPRRRIIQ